MQGGPVVRHVERKHERTAANKVNSMKFNGKNCERVSHDAQSFVITGIITVQCMRMYRAIVVDAVFFLCSCTHTMYLNYGIIV